MHKYFLLLFLSPIAVLAQATFEQKVISMQVTEINDGVKLTIDEPEISTSKSTKIIVYALPNGNTTLQTFGKKLAKGDDWHYDIQHIGAQTNFIRKLDHKTNYIIIYLENSFKSWPQWRRQTKNGDSIIRQLVENIYLKYKNLKPQVILSAHSGGGSFIFGYLNAYESLPFYINRIAFLDATYGYETEKHQLKLKNWLKIKGNSLQVIAYNDSVVVYNGKPLVSPTGGTWYRSKLLANDLGNLKLTETDSQLIYHNKNSSTSFVLLKNSEAKIFHTVLVEKNGFIHTLFNGTKLAYKNYEFWGKRAYESFILE